MNVAGPPGAPSSLSGRDHEILLALASRIDASDAGGRNNLGVLYFNKGLVAEAVSQFHLALEVDPGMPVAARNLEIAYLSTGYYDRLVEELTEQLREVPGDRETRWRLVRAHRHTGHLEEAKSELNRLLASAPGESRYLVELGRAEKDSGAFPRAREAYERALRVDPGSAVLHFHLGELHYHQGNSSEARRMLLRAIELAPSFAEAHHLLSFVLGDLGEGDLAMEMLGRAHELGPWLKDGQAGLSIDRNSVARYEELLGEKWARPVALRDRFLARYHLGVAFRQKGLYDDALREFDRAIESGEDRTLVLQAKAEVLLVAGRDLEAAEIYGLLVREDGTSPKVWNELGVCHHKAGDLTEAEFCYRKALDHDRNYVIAANNLAVARANGGDLISARRGLEAVTEMAPGFDDARCNLGLLAMDERRPREALAAFRAAVEANPHSGSGWLGIGAVLSESGDFQEARKALGRAVEIAPESAEARYRLAFALSRLGDVEGSLRETGRALTLNPYFTSPRLRLSIELQFEYAEVLAPELIRPTRVASDGGLPDFALAPDEISGIFAGLRGESKPARGPVDFSLARDYLTKGLLLRALAEVRRVALAGGDPVDEAILTAEIYRLQGLDGEALERFDTALSHLRDRVWDERQARSWLGRGWSLLALGRAEPAIEAATVVLEQDPGSFDGARLEAEALLSNGDAEGALERFVRLGHTRPNDPSLAMREGAAARAARRLDSARTALERALGLDPHLLAVRVELGGLCLEQGAFEEAVEHGHAALDALPGYAEAALLVAAAEHGRGRPEAAVVVLADLLADDPYHLHALKRLGETLMDMARYDDAVVAFRRILRFDPDSATAWARLGDGLVGGGDQRGAVECWTRAIESGAQGGEAKRLRAGIDHLRDRGDPVRRSA